MKTQDQYIPRQRAKNEATVQAINLMQQPALKAAPAMICTRPGAENKQIKSLGGIGAVYHDRTHP